MIKVLNQTTEYYCSTEKEAQDILDKRKADLDTITDDGRKLGRIMKQILEDKVTSDNQYYKLTIKEEYNLAVDVAQSDPHDDNDYVELFPMPEK
ncbi:hypothetical protein QP168_09420 [Aerococcus urinae]|uniref:Uncharacterized protein n=1 Tax=Aerococcus mictus TaxID=2976810 RepID=A0A1E9PH70_9LACT|nr:MULTISPECIES: hypothetical protein [Aerococcus]KAA9291232.1 hypothetical protein F6I06_06180 [Aerococcus mictus]MBU5611153.1 hypothetical protein [Aerococcus urinae]MCY3064939.1 hypothetical protein [Aerococcus mictus]MCY3077338.1 hypothetical protein [Aerococcus mictus]MCY3081437.1 hypothetical protein [Aerococcus mictus]